MKSATTWFEQYGESHQNPINKTIHWICIPIILVATLGLLSSIPHPFGAIPFVNAGSLVALLGAVFYFRLSATLGVGMSLVLIASLAINETIARSGISLLVVSGGAFFVAWLVQFIGHKIEGKKPSFFQDLQFLLIGPAWLVQFIFRRVGIPVETYARRDMDSPAPSAS